MWVGKVDVIWAVAEFFDEWIKHQAKPQQWLNVLGEQRASDLTRRIKLAHGNRHKAG